MSDGPVKVAIISPHPVVVEGLTAMLDRHRERVETVALTDAVGDDEPDIVLYDVVALADGTGDDLTRLVRCRSCAILLMARDLRPDLLAQALLLGAETFVSMAVSEADLLAAIDAASAGPTTNDPIESGVQRIHLLGADVGLTERESWVLALIVQGLTNDEIAHEGFLSINSVKTYIRTAYRKIGVRNRSQAVVWALQHGYPSQPAAGPLEAQVALLRRLSSS